MTESALETSPATRSLLQQFPFALDAFQIEAINHIAEGHSVVVCAPTGSGKTVIAEFAALLATENGRRLFYTTPLKALSNQKFLDLKTRFGEDNVGLLTGDISINREARLVVMTTEVFRNMLYGIDVEQGAMERLGYVVLDECHFMNDSERGTVWEESIIHCPQHVQMVALSATVANAEELTDWMNSIHPVTKLIKTDFRPVPLRFSFFNREKLLPLFEGAENPKEARLNKKLKGDLKGNALNKKLRQFAPNDLLAEMSAREMLPAILFTFSRKGCDRSLRDTRNLALLTDEERRTIKARVDQFLMQNPFFEKHPMIHSIRNGFASHHAGLLPGIKLLVESLFQQGLIKAVFATETLAAGINMPARSTVITSLTKPTGAGHRMLNGSEFLQMAGRAGRRGMDAVGYVVIVSSQHYGAPDAARLASSDADPLNSQFTPTYGMVLNLLQRHTLTEARTLLSRSFGQFTSERRIQPIKDEMDEKTAALTQAMGFECPYGVSDADFHQFLKTHALRSDTSRFVRTLQHQLKRHGDSPEIRAELEKQRELKQTQHDFIAAIACYDCKLLHKHQNVEKKITQLQKHLKLLNFQYDEAKNVYWQSFLNHYELLKECGHLDADDKPTAKGQLTSQLRCDNELLMTEIISRGIFDPLQPQQLAAVLCCLINDSNRENVYSALRYSPNTRTALDASLKVIKQVRRWQEAHHIETPILYEPVASGLVEAWSVGLTWEETLTGTNLDPGDIVRLIRRTNDLLRQFSRIAELPDALRRTAKQAIAMLYRDPITEIDPIAG